ncbi:hypothetical protein AAGW04_15280 [Pectobacterium aroidearum]
MEGGRTGEGGTRLVRPWMSCLLASHAGAWRGAHGLAEDWRAGIPARARG